MNQELASHMALMQLAFGSTQNKKVLKSFQKALKSLIE